MAISVLKWPTQKSSNIRSNGLGLIRGHLNKTLGAGKAVGRAIERRNDTWPWY